MSTQKIKLKSNTRYSAHRFIFKQSFDQYCKRCWEAYLLNVLRNHTSLGMDLWQVSDLHRFVKQFAKGIGTAFDYNTRPLEANITYQYHETNTIVKLVA